MMLIVSVSLGKAVEVLKCHSSKYLLITFWANSFLFSACLCFFLFKHWIYSVHMYIYVWTQTEGLYLLEYTTWFVYLHTILFFKFNVETWNLNVPFQLLYLKQGKRSRGLCFTCTKEITKWMVLNFEHLGLGY